MVQTVMLDWDLTRRKPLRELPPGHPRILAFIQARRGSTRLPGKIYRQIGGAPMLYRTISAAKESRMIDDVIIASPEQLDLPPDIKEYVYTGPEGDVLSRYSFAAVKHPCDYVVRLTSDCPFLDPHLIDAVVLESIGFDYGSNVLVRSFPSGQDIEVISIQTLAWLDDTVRERYDREHVTTFIRNNRDVQKDLRLMSIESIKDYSYIKLSVDTEEDLAAAVEFDKCLEKGKQYC